MPIVNVKLLEGVFSAEQKQSLLPHLANAIESVYPGLGDMTYITIEEVKKGEWGIGGRAVTTENVAAHAKDNAARRENAA